MMICDGVLGSSGKEGNEGGSVVVSAKPKSVVLL